MGLKRSLVWNFQVFLQNTYTQLTIIQNCSNFEGATNDEIHKWWKYRGKEFQNGVCNEDM